MSGKPSQRAKRKTRVRIQAFEDGRVRERRDDLATEEPLELRLEAAGETRTLAITMRTPGDDFELAAGYLFSEGVIKHRDDLKRLYYCTNRAEPQQYNIITAELSSGSLPDLRGLERSTFTSSACGVCGKASLESLELRGVEPLADNTKVDAKLLMTLPEALRASQGLFELTGGLHAAALFDVKGKLIALKEDIGRHNALDKLLGWALLEERLPLDEYLPLLSGRASYELMQKALTAQLPVVCAISAPSSLAVELARNFHVTLVGFLRGGRFNIYAAAERLEPRHAHEATNISGGLGLT